MALKLVEAEKIREDLISFLRGKPKGFTNEQSFQSARVTNHLDSQGRTSALAMGLSVAEKGLVNIEIRAYQKGAVELAKLIAKGIDGQLGITSLDDSPVVIKRALRGKLSSPDWKLNGFPPEIRPLRKHKRPLFLGQGIGNARNNPPGAVTLGCFLRLNDDDIAALSVSHGIIGLGSSSGTIGDRVSQPHVDDTSNWDHHHVIGEVLFASGLRPNTEMRCDAALVKLNDVSARNVVGNRLPDAEFDADLTAQLKKMGMAEKNFGRPISEGSNKIFFDNADAEGMRVFKLGCGSGWSEGKISGQRLLTTLYHDGKPYKFLDTFDVVPCDPTETFSKGGDSGALVFTETGNQLVGLGLILGLQSLTTVDRATGKEMASVRTSIICPLAPILEHLETNQQTTDWFESD
jgi:hypothetical protein